VHLRKIRLESATEKDLVISLISGGDFALLSLAPEGISLADKQATTDLLIKTGAAIHEINAVRAYITPGTQGKTAETPDKGVSFIDLVFGHCRGYKRDCRLAHTDGKKSAVIGKYAAFARLHHQRR